MRLISIAATLLVLTSPAMAQTASPQARTATPQAPIRAGQILRDLRRWTCDYVPPEEACPSWRALWSGLEALEADLHMHIHLENNILHKQALSS